MKLKPSNIYYMIAYANEIDAEKSIGEKDGHTLDSFDNIDDILGLLLSKFMGSVIKSGMVREYRENIESTRNPHGTIHISESINKGTRVKNELICGFDVFDEITYTNSIIKTAIDRLLKKKLNKNVRSSLKNIDRYLVNVPIVYDLNIDYDRCKYYGRNHNYIVSLWISKLYLKSLFLSEGRDYQLNKLLMIIRPEILFEKFVSGYYKIHYDSIHVGKKEIPFFIGNNSIDDYGSLPKPECDIILHDKGSKKTLIIDTKYYDKAFENNTYDSSHIFQICNYINNYCAKTPEEEVSGMLLYAQTEESIPDEMHNILGKDVYFRTIDMSKRWDEIKQTLDNIPGIIVSSN